VENVNQNDIVKNIIFIKVKSKFVKIKLQDIYMVSALGDYICFHTAKQKYIVKSSMKAIINHLPTNDFIRIHQSFIVNVDKITVINFADCVVNNESIPISRANRKKLLDRIEILGF
jgi:DNA-binding LytR/AlgR family response regulator